MDHLPLQGLTVLEFSQYLSGPSAGLRLADLGARVIKIERPGTGDACRKLAIKNLWADDGSSLLFHTINRNKESFTADLKDPHDVALVKKLIAKADVVTHNFRPGIMEKVGLDYASVKAIKPTIIYAVISGYGKVGPWKDRPGQDLLIQSISGLAYTSANHEDNPTPFGIAIADIICGAHMVQGILAALIRRQKKGIGALIELSLLESLLDFQFELLTTYYTNNKLPQRSKLNNAQPLLGAPYGLYQTTDGFIAIAMVEISKLAGALDCDALKRFTQQDVFKHRDEIKDILVDFLRGKSSSYWLEKLHRAGIWAMELLDWKAMTAHPAYKTLMMEQKIRTAKGHEFLTTRCPITINGERLYSSMPAPILGEHTTKIKDTLLSMPV
jgi:CoA:oxalate CoA-transferase